MTNVDLVQVMRGGVVDCVHQGRVAVVDAEDALVFSAGDPEAVTFLRSSAKPFQAATVLRCGAAEKFNFTDEEISIIAGSHNGTPAHVQLVTGILEKIGLDINDLQCGASPPLNEKARRDLYLSGAMPSAVHHNCSGKHAGMLAACLAQGWDIKTYLLPDHPLQVMNRQVMAECAGMNAEDVVIALDGCGVPTFGLPLRNIARMFARLAVAVHAGGDDLGRVGRAMQQYPYAFSGEKRIDTALMVSTGSRLVAKDGAEGLLGVAVTGHGVGVALKVADGNNRAHVPVMATVLTGLDYISQDERATLEEKIPLAVVNNHGQQAGEMRTVIHVLSAS